MITFCLHWSWILIAVVLIATAVISYPHFRGRGDSIGRAFDSVIGIVIAILGILIAAVLGGIFVW